MTIEDKIEAIIPLLENADETISVYRREQKINHQDKDSWSNSWYKHFIKCLVGEAIISKRAKVLIEGMKPSVEEGYVGILAQKVADDILFEQSDDIWDKCLDPAIKRTAKNIYDCRNVYETDIITNKKEFKGYFGIKGDHKWVSFGERPTRLMYVLSIKARYIETKWCSIDSPGNTDTSQRLYFPFEADSYNAFIFDTMDKVKAIWGPTEDEYKNEIKAFGDRHMEK